MSKIPKQKPYYRRMPSDYKTGGVAKFVTAADGYAMIRRPGCIPFVVPVEQWNDWPECDKDGNLMP